MSLKPSYTRNIIIDMIDERLKYLDEELRDYKGIGIDTPGFNQTLGARAR